MSNGIKYATTIYSKNIIYAFVGAPWRLLEMISIILDEAGGIRLNGSVDTSTRYKPKYGKSTARRSGEVVFDR